MTATRKLKDMTIMWAVSAVIMLASTLLVEPLCRESGWCNELISFEAKMHSLAVINSVVRGQRVALAQM